MEEKTEHLCLTCHDALRPGAYRSEDAHPILSRNSESGSDLTCISCHTMHNGHERSLLRAPQTESNSCRACHADKESVIDSTHDLRNAFPDERNRLGLTSGEGGPCSACHLVHRPARPFVPGPYDASGSCLTCHNPEGCAQDRPAPAHSHPSESCVDCHNPHANDHGAYLSAAPQNVCLSCHEEQQLLVGSMHDITKNGKQWERLGDANLPDDACLSCHKPHAESPDAMFTLIAENAHLSDQTCRACHAESDLHFDHPDSWNGSTANPSAGDMHLGCKVCHNPHAGPPAVALLHSGNAVNSDICITCHQDKSTINLTPHGGASLAAKGAETVGCQPCHNVHASAGVKDAEAAVGKSGQCTSCHKEDGMAQVVAAIHPDVPLFSPDYEMQEQTLRLFSNTGENRQGEITCRTCHLPHGRTDVPGSAITASGHSNLRLLLKPFRAPNTCTNCHGEDAIRKFLYFHHPSRRSELSR